MSHLTFHCDGKSVCGETKTVGGFTFIFPVILLADVTKVKPAVVVHQSAAHVLQGAVLLPPLNHRGGSAQKREKLAVNP